MSRRLVLASASPARLRLLRAAGFAPDVVVSGVDESTVATDDPVAMVEWLALAKAAAVAARLTDAVVVGCDSALDVDGVAHGKPGGPAEASRRWHRLAGRSAVLLTGHAVIDVRGGVEVGRVVAHRGTVVHFASPSPAEVAAYVGSGEPLQVAGAFTLDGRGALFVEGIEGDPSNVVGLSLPLLRHLLGRLGISAVDLWER